MTKLIIGKEYIKCITELIDNARMDIEIAFFEFRYYRKQYKQDVSKIVISIINARTRGVKVRILLNSSYGISKLRRFNLETKGRLEQRGCEVEMFKASVRLHVKMMIIDRRYLVVGSHNISRSAMTKNIEMSVMVDDVEQVRRAREYFELLF